MKRLIAFFAAALLVLPSLSFAKPERMELKSDQRKAKEEMVKGKTKALQLGRIQDPETKKAIQEILNYLELPYKN